MFSACTVPPDSKETELGSSDQEASPSAGKNTRIVSVSCYAWKCVPTAMFSGVDTSKVPGCHVLRHESSVRVTKLYVLVFVFRDFNVHHKEWLISSGGTDRPAKHCYNFSISNDLTQMVDFRTQIPDCDSHNIALLDLFLLMLVFVLQWLSLNGFPFIVKF